MLILKHVSTYEDGGTQLLIDDKGNKYFKDYRFSSKTRGKVFDKYPNDPKAEEITETIKIRYS